MAIVCSPLLCNDKLQVLLCGQGREEAKSSESLRRHLLSRVQGHPTQPPSTAPIRDPIDFGMQKSDIRDETVSQDNNDKAEFNPVILLALTV